MSIVERVHETSLWASSRSLCRSDHGPILHDMYRLCHSNFMVASIRPHYGMFPLGTSTRCPNGPPYLQLEESLACESSLQHVSVRVLSGFTVHAIVEFTLPSMCVDSVIGRLNVLPVESLEISAQRYSCSVLQEACRPGTGSQCWSTASELLPGY